METYKVKVGDLLIIDDPTRYACKFVGYVYKEYKSLTRKQMNDGVSIMWVNDISENVTHIFAQTMIENGSWTHIPGGVRVSTEIDTTEQK